MPVCGMRSSAKPDPGGFRRIGLRPMDGPLHIA